MRLALLDTGLMFRGFPILLEATTKHQGKRRMQYFVDGFREEFWDLTKAPLEEREDLKLTDIKIGSYRKFFDSGER